MPDNDTTIPSPPPTVLTGPPTEISELPTDPFSCFLAEQGLLSAFHTDVPALRLLMDQAGLEVA